MTTLREDATLYVDHHALDFCSYVWLDHESALRMLLHLLQLQQQQQQQQQY